MRRRLSNWIPFSSMLRPRFFRSDDKRFTFLIWIALLATLALVEEPSFAACAIRTADPGAGLDVCSIVTWLRALPSRHTNNILSGQYGWKDTKLIHDITGKWPALYEDHLWQMRSSSWGEWKEAGDHERTIKQYWDNGGLVGIHMPIPNPKNKSDQLDRDLSDKEFRDINLPGTELNRNYIEWMGSLAKHLRRLQEQGVTVFIRPLHEMNGGWFWYGKRNPEEFKKLFRMTIKFLTEEQGLHNLIVVYAPNKGKGVADYYPGDDVVDVVGVDSYQEQPALLNEEYAALSRINKPFAITEIGWSAQGLAKADTRDSKQDILDGIKRFEPKAVWWSSWTDTNSPAHQQDCKQLYDDPSVITRDELNWRK